MGLITPERAAKQDVAFPASPVRPAPGNRRRAFWPTFAAVVLVAAFLSPLVQAALTAVKSQDQITQANAPVLPSDPATFEFEGKIYDVYEVPVDGDVRELALVKQGRTESEFLDPANPEAGPIVWQGSWRTLDPVWRLAPVWTNFSDVWTLSGSPACSSTRSQSGSSAPSAPWCLARWSPTGSPGFDSAGGACFSPC